MSSRQNEATEDLSNRDNEISRKKVRDDRAHWANSYIIAKIQQQQRGWHKCFLNGETPSRAEVIFTAKKAAWRWYFQINI